MEPRARKRSMDADPLGDRQLPDGAGSAASSGPLAFEDELDDLLLPLPPMVLPQTRRMNWEDSDAELPADDSDAGRRRRLPLATTVCV